MPDRPSLSGTPPTPLTKAHDLDLKTVVLRYWINDHAWLRAVLPNFYKVDEDLFRANHPGARTLRRAQARGVQSVLSLRGGADNTPNIIERDICAGLGLELRFLRMRTAYLPSRDTLLELIRLLRDMPKPILVHCKSGADRTGLAVTLYLHVIKGQPMTEARRALHWRYAHLSWGKAGIVHRMLDAYSAAHAKTAVTFEDWVATEYDPATFQR